MKPTVCPAITLVVGLLLSGVSHAQTAGTANRPGLDLGIRFGYAIPFGNISGAPGDGMNDNFWGATPFVLEADYRVNGAVSVGGLFQYGILQIKENANTGCEDGLSCSGSVVRLGIQGIYHILVPSRFIPWVGLGAGYEWMNIHISQGGASASSGAHGFELLTLQAGGDFRLSPHLSIGPYASFTIARYGTETFVNVPGLPIRSSSYNYALLYG
jgi:Outer membrane protein beta-barrel domain